MPEELLTATQVAELAGMHKRTVQRMIADGRLVPERKLPGRTGAYLFRRCDIAALAEPEPAA